MLTNRKAPQHRGTVALAEITRLYDEALALVGQDKRVKVLDRAAFGFQRVRVERPLRRVWHLTEEAVDELARSTAWTAWAVLPKGADDPVAYVHEVEQAQAALADALRGLASAEASATENEFGTAPVLTDKRGDPLPDPDLRDQENVSLPEGWFDLREEERAKALRASAEAHLDAEIRRYAGMRGSTTPRRRSAWRSRSPGTSTPTCRPGRSPRSTRSCWRPRSASASPWPGSVR